MRLRLAALPPLALVAAAAGSAGCARSAEERQLDQMRNEIDSIQAERDDADRDAVGSSASSAPDAVPPGTQPPAGAHPVASPPRPSMTAAAVPLDDSAPDPQGDDYVDPDDPTPRPTLRMSGNPHRTGRAGAPESGSGDDAAYVASSALDPDAKRAYDAALSLVTSKQCAKAIDAFAAFLVKWPDHPYADNAMFWRGHCYFQAGDYVHAAEQLEGVLARFPAGNKAPDALLKLGMAEDKLGDEGKAQECYGRLLGLYPQSDAARHIPRTPSSASRASAPRGPTSEDSR